jgi:hypothetical protein
MLFLLRNVPSLNWSYPKSSPTSVDNFSLLARQGFPYFDQETQIMIIDEKPIRDGLCSCYSYALPQSKAVTMSSSRSRTSLIKSSSFTMLCPSKPRHQATIYSYLLTILQPSTGNHSTRLFAQLVDSSSSTPSTTSSSASHNPNLSNKTPGL